MPANAIHKDARGETGNKHIPRGNRQVHNRNFTPEMKSLLRPKDTCIHLDAVEEHHTNVTSLPASYRMMSG